MITEVFLSDETGCRQPLGIRIDPNGRPDGRVLHVHKGFNEHEPVTPADLDPEGE